MFGFFPSGFRQLPGDPAIKRSICRLLLLVET